MGMWEGCLNEDGVCLLPPFLWVVYKLLLTSCGQYTHLGSLPVGDRHNSHIDSNHTRCTQNSDGDQGSLAAAFLGHLWP